MHRVPAQRNPRRAPGAFFGMHIAAVLLVGAIAAPPSLRAEPIALAGSAGEARAPGIAGVSDSAARVGALPSDSTDELAIPATVRHSSASPGFDSEDAPAAKQAAGAPAPQPPATGVPTKKEPPASDARRSVPPLSAIGDETSDEQPDWEREIKETIRPIYDELAARGIIDAVQGFRSYLAMLGVYLSGENVTPAGQRARVEGVAEPPGGVNEATWAARSAQIDAQTLGRSEAQNEKERLIAALFVQEWLAAALPWIYGFTALFIAWQVARLTFAFARARSARLRRRAAKSHHRSAAAARMRARS